MFYLQNVERKDFGNSALFWKIGNYGYTPRLEEAKEMTEAEADGIIKGHHGPRKFIKWAVEDIDAVKYETVDIQDLPVTGR